MPCLLQTLIFRGSHKLVTFGKKLSGRNGLVKRTLHAVTSNEENDIAVLVQVTLEYATYAWAPYVYSCVYVLTKYKQIQQYVHKTIAKIETNLIWRLVCKLSLNLYSTNKMAHGVLSYKILFR